MFINQSVLMFLTMNLTNKFKDITYARAHMHAHNLNML